MLRLERAGSRIAPCPDRTLVDRTRPSDRGGRG